MIVQKLPTEQLWTDCSQPLHYAFP